jgi:hypothetical protein
MFHIIPFYFHQQSCVDFIFHQQSLDYYLLGIIRGAYFLLIKLYILKTNHCGWNPEQNSTYNSPRIINICEIDRNYLILTINEN